MKAPSWRFTIAKAELSSIKRRFGDWRVKYNSFVLFERSSFKKYIAFYGCVCNKEHLDIENWNFKWKRIDKI